MSDTLEIFGQTYYGVTGIKATDDNDDTLTYVRYEVADIPAIDIDLASYEDVMSLAINSSTGRITADVLGNIVTHPVDTPGFVDTTDAITIRATGTTTLDLTTQAARTVTPTTSAQTAVPAGRWTTGAVTVAAMPTGTAGTPTATKGAVSNHSVTVTPSVTNTTGYITGSTKTGTGVTVSASELVSGSQTITQNGTVDVTNLSNVVVNVAGSGGLQVGTVDASAYTTTTLTFTGLSGEPTSFALTFNNSISTGTPARLAALAWDGTDYIGQTITNTANAQVSYESTGFSHTYNNGTLTVTSTNAQFQGVSYSLVYSYGGSSANIGTSDVQVGSGATSIAFTGLPDEPSYFSCVFKSDFGTSSGYNRVIAVVYNGENLFGMEMGAAATPSMNWTHAYSNGTLTITSQSTSAGGYFHQPGYYQLTYGIGEAVPIEVEPLSVTANGTYTAPTGTAYSPVTVNVSGGGAPQIDTKTMTNSSNTATSISFTGLNGVPKAFFVRTTTQISSSGSTTYYYVTDMRFNGTNTTGNVFRIGSTRRVENVTSGYSYSYSGTTLTVSSSGSRTASPGSFYNGGYELVYVY